MSAVPVATAGAIASSRTEHSLKKSDKKSHRTAWLMLLPAGVLMITFLLIPIGLTFLLAFTNARLISPEPARFIGVSNFVRLFENETFWKSLTNTVVFAAVIVPVQSAIALVYVLGFAFA